MFRKFACLAADFLVTDGYDAFCQRVAKHANIVVVAIE